MKHLIPKLLGKITVRYILLTLIVICSALWADTAQASHFRHGTISWRVLSGNTIEFKISQAWANFGNFSIGDNAYTNSINFGDGQVISFAVVVTSTTGNGGTNWVYGEKIITHTYASVGNYTAYFSGCCKISNLSNNADGNWRNETLVNVGIGNDSPVTTMAPIINMQTNTPAATFQVPAFDPDGDVLTYRLATFAEMSGGQPANFSINGTTGVITYNTNGLAVGSLWNAAIVVEDGNTHVVNDFIIKIVQQSNPPVFDYTVTPAIGTVFQVAPGTAVNFSVKASDSDVGSTVTLQGIGIPVGANLSPSLPATSNPITSAFSWTPTASNLGANVINFLATDDVGAQVSTSVTISVSLKPVFDVPPTPAANTYSVYAPGAFIGYTVQASDPDSLDVVEITKVEGKDSGGNPIPLYSGAFFSSLPTSALNPTSGSFSWTPLGSDWGLKNIFYTAEDSYGDETEHEVFQLINTIPSLSSIAPISIVAGQTYTYNITTIDADMQYGDKVEIVSALVLPSWLTLTTNVNNGTAVLTGVPSIGDGGTHTINLLIEDIHHAIHGTVPVHNFVITVIPCDLSVTSTGQDVSCVGSNDGSVTIVTTGGTAPFVINPSTTTGLVMGTYTYTITDANACIETTTAFVGLADNTPPNVITQNITVQLGAGGNVTVTALQIDGGSSDGCGISTLSIYPNAFSCTDVGIQTVTLTVTDVNGNSNTGTATVTVQDVSAPNITCQFDVTVSADEGSCGAVVNYNAPSATDNCGTGALPTTLAGFSYQGMLNGHTYFLSNGTDIPENAHAIAIALGGHLVTINDAAENTFVSLFNSGRIWIGHTDRAVEGTWEWITGEPVVYTNWAPFEPNNAGNEDWAVINWSGTNPDWNDWTFNSQAYYAIEFDGGTLSTTLFSGIGSGGFFPVGTTTETWSVTDASGNVSTCSFNITVIDNEAPTVICMDDISVSVDSSLCGANISIPFLGTSSCNANWAYSADVTISSTNSIALNNYQVKLTVNTLALIAGSKLNADGSDLRFADANCNNLSYWIESGINTSNTVIWVKVPLIAANASTTIQMYYGNQTASAASSGIQTFISFDDFNDGDANGWTINNGSWSVVSGNLKVTNPGGGAGVSAVLLSSVGQTEYVVETDYYPINSGSFGGPLYEYTDASNYYAMHSMPGNNLVMKSQITNGSADYGASWNVVHNHGAWHNFRAERSSTANNIYFNDAFVTSHGHVFADGAGLWGFGSDILFDNFRVREFADVVPTTTVGGENSNVMASDNCTIASIVNSYNNTGDASDFYPVGTTNVTYSVTDVSGNVTSCSFNITVTDDELPTAITQALTVHLDSNGIAGINAIDVDNGSNDACGVASLDLDNYWFNCANVGTNTVTLSVTDFNGNVGTATATITVLDVDAPQISFNDGTVNSSEDGLTGCDFTGYALSGGGTYTIIGDNCSSSFTVQEDEYFNGSLISTNTWSLTAGTWFPWRVWPVGTTTIIVTVFDDSGNSSSGSYTQTVVDDEAPITMVQNPTVQLDAWGNGSINVGDIDDGSNDACGIASISISDSMFTCESVGMNMVWLTVTDVNGNVSVDSAIVTVEDNVAPIAMSQDITVQLDSSGMVSITPGDVDNGSNDGCGIMSMTISSSEFDCYDVGPNMVWLTVTDNNGNVSVDSSWVTVEDNVAPVALCQAVSVTLVDGMTLVTPEMLDNGSSDACGIASMTISDSAWTCDDIGEHTVTLTVTDVNGNVSTCSSVVTVIGEIPTLSIASAPTCDVYTGGDSSIIYLGYGSQSTMLTTTVGGGDSFTYTWLGADLDSNSLANPTFTPTIEGYFTFTCTVVNNYGCEVTETITICVRDIRYVKGGKSHHGHDCDHHCDKGHKKGNHHGHKHGCNHTCSSSGSSCSHSCSHGHKKGKHHKHKHGCTHICDDAPITCIGQVCDHHCKKGHKHGKKHDKKHGCSHECDGYHHGHGHHAKKGHDKVYICHTSKGKKGGPMKTKTLKVDVKSVASHLSKHAGDALGMCNTSCSDFNVASKTGEMISEEFEGFDIDVILYPNPAIDFFTVMVESDMEELVSVEVYDLAGNLVQQVQGQMTYMEIELGQDLAAGVYVVIVRQGEFKTILKAAKTH